LKTSSALIKRLDPYWKMEAGNAIALPALMLFLSGGAMGWVSALALMPMTLLLIIGAVYWWAKVRQLKDRRYDIGPMLTKIGALRLPVLILTVIGTIAAIASWLIDGVAISTADKVCASVAAALAVLEYINYYHRQLQHFDNVADFKRLISGKGFRVSQMARDLRAHGFRY
jgi:hypothetical protein